MTRHVGLTDDPDRCRLDHGNPPDWELQAFCSEDEAQAWHERMLGLGCKGEPEDGGWHFGFTCTRRTHIRRGIHGKAA